MPMDMLDLAWRFFSSRRLTIALLVGTALVLACGAILPQMPDDVTVDSAQYARWYASVQAQYLQWADRLAQAGLFSIRDSLWLRAPLALLLVNLVVCAAEQVWTILGEGKLGPREFAQAFPPASQAHSFLFAGDPQSASGRSRSLLEAHGYRVLTQEGTNDSQLAARRFHSARWGIVLAHAGLTLIVVSALTGGRLGWHERGITLGPGQEYQLQHAESTSVRLDDFQAELYPDGRPRWYQADVALLEKGTVATSAVLTAGAPLSYRGMSFHQLSHGPLVSIRAVDAGGAPVTLRTLGPSSMIVEEASLQLSEDEREGYIAVPAKNLVLRAILQPEPASGGEDSPGLLLQAYRGGATDLVYSETLHGPARVDIEGDTYIIEWGQYAIIGIASDPTFSLILLGAVALLVGTTGTTCRRPRSIWAAFTGRQGVVEMRLLYRGYAGDITGTHEFGTLMAEMEEACRGG
jgi:cytochrome c biogenesis protein ResB